MEHFFELPVQYNGKELTFNGRLVTFGYVYKFYLMIEDQEYVFERDDEQNYRMLATENHIERSIDMNLIKAVVEVLDKL